MFNSFKHILKHSYTLAKYTHNQNRLLNQNFYQKKFYSSDLNLTHQQIKNLQYYAYRHLFDNIKMNPNSDQQIPEVDPKTGEIIINPLKEDGTEKTPKEIEKEKKKAEKMLKSLAKQAKKEAPAAKK